MKKAQNRWSRILLTITLAALTAVCVLIIIAIGVHLRQSFTIKDAETIAVIRANFSQELVFSLLGVAISVWIGLNIYNVLSKEDLQVLVEKTEETARRVEETAEKVTEDAYTEVVISKLRLMPADRIENYLASRFVEIERLPCDILKLIVLLEDKFNYAYALYVAGSAVSDLAPMIALICQIETLAQDCHTQGIISEEQHRFLGGYIALRKADFAFSTLQYSSSHICEKERMADAKKMIENYKEALTQFFHAEFAWSVNNFTAEECQGVALIQNSICGAYLVFAPWENWDDDAHKDAILAGETAIKFAGNIQPHIRAVFFRNLGAAHERDGDCKKAMEYYQQAYSNDSTDPKILHCIASLYRKELGKIIDRENVSKDEKEKLLEQSTYWYWMELIHRGGAMPKDSWPVDLQKYAEKLHAKKFQEQALRDVLRLGEKCRKELASMAESKS